MVAESSASSTRQFTTSGDTPLAVLLRIGVATIAICAMLAAFVIATHHPLGASGACAAAAVVLVLAYRFWTRWPFWLLGLLPLAGLAPWTGWISVDESDMLVWASIGGGYLAWSRIGPARTPPREQSHRRTLRWTLSTAMLLAACFVWALLTAAIGVEDAGGWSFGWYQGYHEPLHAWRAAKPMIWLVLLFPWWARIARRAPHRALRAWAEGMALGLVIVGLGVVWERSAFTSLMNFSSDYRTTSVFWEMHVGGAALDGTLALGFPLAVWLAMRAGSGRQALGAYAVLALATYAVMTTFSRGLYLAIASGGAWMAYAHWRAWQQRRRSSPAMQPADATVVSAAKGVQPTDVQATRLRVLLTLGLGTTIASAFVFAGGGYRALGAFLASMLVLVLQRGSRTAARRVGAGVLLLMGLPLAVFVTALAAAIAFPLPKSAYGLFALAWILALVLALRSRLQRRKPMERLHVVGLAASWATCIGLTGVLAWYWGESNALVSALPALVLVLPMWSIWHSEGALAATQDMHWRAGVGALAGTALLASVLAVVLGGTRVHERMNTVADDFAGRLEHWQSSVRALDDSDAWLTGVGAGRFVSRRLFTVPREERTGDYRLEQLDNERFVRVIGGQHAMRGSALRLSQRVGAMPASLTLNARLRSVQGAEVLFELCEKHLLYPGRCREAQHLAVHPQGDESSTESGWQTLRLDWRGHEALGTDMLPPRGVVFSVSLAGRGQTIDIESLSLTSDDGREWLHNGSFREGLSRWFFTSDHHHLPWHIKSLPLHVLFEQGIVGLSLWAAFVLGGLSRVTFGWGREHPLAPVLAASLIGFLAVGLFDSLIDASRVAFMFYATALLAWGVRVPGESTNRRSRRHRHSRRAREPNAAI